mmetsp:Transcript_75591/g.179632  ORF Transcript_75591/g.179632 Transcript_75591/m.179632 type:complete len:88 (+) Transcript_75591:1123-1386(+)
MDIRLRLQREQLLQGQVPESGSPLLAILAKGKGGAASPLQTGACAIVHGTSLGQGRPRLPGILGELLPLPAVADAFSSAWISESADS